jgi:signal transduction histidine kinase
VKWLRGLSPVARDRLFALALFAASLAEVLLVAGTDQPVVAVAAVALLTLPLAERRRAPLVVAAACLAGAFVLVEVGGVEEFSAPLLVVGVLAFLLGLSRSTRHALAGLLVVFVGVAAIATADDETVLGDYVFPMGFAAVAWGGARALRHRTDLAAELHEAALREEERREIEAARATAEERRRVAREMHDVVAHTISIMVVQAGGARRILEHDPDRAADAARNIERTGRGALGELRRLLGLMHGGEEDATVVPQPTLDGLEALVERARAAGLPVQLHVDGERRPLPAGAELAAYRVVQESLTNALVHAAGAPTDVTLRWDPEALSIVVADRGPMGATPPSESSGQGIVGMRERVRVYGGTLTAAPRMDGGFVVRARIPLQHDDGRS